MLRSIATVSISGTLPEKLHAIAAAGYQGVEIFENDLLYYTGTPYRYPPPGGRFRAKNHAFSTIS